MSHRFIDGVWFTCGCGGSPRDKVKIPLGSVELIYTGVAARWEVGQETGIKYQILSNRILLDIDAGDAEYMLDTGHYRIAQTADRRKMTGIEARKH